MSDPTETWLSRLRQSFWLFAMDVVAHFGGFGSRLYLWCVGKASDATHWGPPCEPDDPGKEYPF